MFGWPDTEGNADFNSFSQPRCWKQAGLVPVSGVCMENTYCMGLINIDIIYLLLWPLSVLGAIATQDLFVES